MSVDKFNSEGYYDPTAYEAMSTVEKEERALRAFRPIVYICSPYAGEIEKNVKAAQGYSRFAVEKGYIPIAPHLLFPQFLNDANPKERQLGLFFGNALMSKCSEVWVFGSRSLGCFSGSISWNRASSGKMDRLFLKEAYNTSTYSISSSK